MFLDEDEHDEKVLKWVVSALDLVVAELRGDHLEFEVYAESANTVEGVFKDQGRFRQILERAGLSPTPMSREELQEKLSEKRDRTEEKSGAYVKVIAEIEVFKSQVLSKDVDYETSEKILDILMVGLARSSSRILDSVEWGHDNLSEHLGRMIVYARAIKAGFDASIDLRYPFDIILG